MVKLNQLCGIKINIFSGTRVPRKRNLIVTPKVDRNEKEPHEEHTIVLRRLGNELITTKLKILTHFLKGKITFTPLKTILTILGELEYLEGL